MSDSVPAVLRRLSDVLARENAALAAMDLSAATAFLPEKTAALTALEAVATPVGALPDPEAWRLADLARDNKYLLERAMAAQQHVIGIVVRAASSVAAGGAYGASGRLAGMRRPMSLSTRV